MTQAFVSSERLDAAQATAIRGALIDAINRCCSARGDTEGTRLDLIAECTALPHDQQRDLVEHFNDQTRLLTRGFADAAEVDAAQPSAAGRVAAASRGAGEGAMPPAVPQPAHLHVGV